MKKNSLTGWQKVFSFTLIQTLKAPAMIVATLFLVGLALISLPALSAITGEEDTVKQETSIERLVILDETSLKLSEWLDILDMGYEGALPSKIEFSGEDIEVMKEKLTQEKEENWALIEISYSEEEYCFSVVGMYGTKTSVSEDDLSEITNLISAKFQDQMVHHLDISEEQIAYINHEVEQEISYLSVGEDGNTSINEEEKDNESKITMTEYTVVLMFLCLVIMIISMSGEQVASAVLSEKSSKVVEYLLINVKPLALMIGKVLAMFVVTLIQLILLVAGFAGSAGLYVIMNQGSFSDILTMISSVFGEAEGASAALSINLACLPISLIIVLMGALFYGTIAALAGACVSRMEELTECMKMFSVTMLVGAYGSMAIVIADMSGSAPMALAYFVELFPITSVFLTPGYLLLGQLPLWVGLMALIIMAAAVMLLFMFSANVYETLIYHKGNPLKIKDLIIINKNAKKGAEK